MQLLYAWAAENRHAHPLLEFTAEDILDWKDIWERLCPASTSQGTTYISKSTCSANPALT